MTSLLSKIYGGGVQEKDSLAAIPTVKKVSGASPFSRQGFSLSVNEHRKEIYIFGGMRDGAPLNDIATLTMSGLWSFHSPIQTIGSAPSPRVYATATLLDQKVYVYGGLTNFKQPDDAVYSFNTETKVWSQPRIQGQGDVSARYGHKTCAVGQRMFVFGGSGPDGFLNDMIVLDSSAGVMRWQIASTGNGHENGLAPCPRSYHTLTTYGADKILLFGGECSYDCMADVWEFSTKTCKWSLLKSDSGNESGPCPRYHHSASLYRDYLIISGGKNFEGTQLEDIWVFDLKQRQWIYIGGLGVKVKFEHQACLFKDKLIIMGGSELEVNTVHILDLAKVKFGHLSSVMQPPSPPRTPVGNRIEKKSSDRSLTSKDTAEQVADVHVPVDKQDLLPPMPLMSPPAGSPVEYQSSPLQKVSNNDEEVQAVKRDLLLTKSRLQDSTVALQKTQQNYQDLQAEFVLLENGARSNSKAYQDMERTVKSLASEKEHIESSLTQLKRAALHFANVLPDLEFDLKQDSSSAVLLTIAQALKSVHVLYDSHAVSNQTNSDQQIAELKHQLLLKDEMMSKLKVQFAERMATKAKTADDSKSQEQVISLNSQLEDSCQQASQLQAQVKGLQEAESQCRSQVDSLKIENVELQAHCRTIEAGFAQSMQVVDTLQSSINQLKSQLNTVTLEKDALEALLVKNAQDNKENEKQLLVQFEELKSNSEVGALDVGQLKLQAALLEKELAKLHSEKQILLQQSFDSAAQLEAFKTQTSNLTQEKLRLEKDLEDIKVSLAGIESSTSDILAERDIYKAELLHVKTQAREESQHVCDQSDAEQLRQSIAEQQQQIQELESQNQQTQQLRQQVKDLEEQLKAAQSVVAQSEHVMTSIPPPPPMPQQSGAIPPPPPQPSQTGSAIPPPPPPPPGPTIKVHEVLEDESTSRMNSSSLLAEIQAKKLRKSQEVGQENVKLVQPKTLDPIAQMMAEMQAKKLKKSQKAATVGY